MFRLIRLATYALVGYAAYQIFTEVTSESPAKPTRRGSRAGGSRASSPMTGQKRGGGAGKAETSHEPDGGAVSHRVGRGVV